MKAQDFEKHSKEIHEYSWNLMFNKAKEYASDEDRLENFKQATTLFGVNPSQVCMYWDAKHIASMVKMAQDIDKGIFPSKEMLREKVADYLNYGVLFYSLILEILESQQNMDS